MISLSISRCQSLRAVLVRVVVVAIVTTATGVAALPLSAAADPLSAGQDYGVVPGARPGPATATIPTWRDVFTDPTNGTTYSEDIVGAQDPRTPGAGTTTIPTEIVPVDLSFEANNGEAFNGSEVTQAVIHSPIFQPADYSGFSNNVGVQYGDAMMRSQFNQVGDSPFHLELQPKVLPTLALSVPKSKGEVKAYPSGAQYGCVDFYWLANNMWSYIHAQHISPTTLPILIVKYTRGGLERSGNCQPIFAGIHGAGNPGRNLAAFNSETTGQTWMIATYEPAPIRPITPGHPYTFKNVDTLAHEVAEWMNDPYGLNLVQPYSFPASAGGGCGVLYESGDPVNRYTIGLPGNTYFQNLPGNDGTWSIQDEVFLPWFAREAPNMTSEPEASSGYGRYTFFGDLNPDPAFHTPAAAC